jgi:hypothetical protein
MVVNIIRTSQLYYSDTAGTFFTRNTKINNRKISKFSKNIKYESFSIDRIYLQTGLKESLSIAFI